ncbi:hypothetical protein PJ261_02215 [Streptococcus dysgalactiae]|uniref:hypothetical protein n=1 Tax=Streptococcus dysgalactiae TaxID=1334 RepID=UPI0035CF0487
MKQQLDILDEKKVGFYDGFYKFIPEGVLTKIFLDFSQEQMLILSEEKAKEVILAKSVLQMTYKNFQEVSSYLFTYRISDGQRPLARQLDDSIESFTVIKFWAKQRLEELNYEKNY